MDKKFLHIVKSTSLHDMEMHQINTKLGFSGIFTTSELDVLPAKEDSDMLNILKRIIPNGATMESKCSRNNPHPPCIILSIKRLKDTAVLNIIKTDGKWAPEAKREGLELILRCFSP